MKMNVMTQLRYIKNPKKSKKNKFGDFFCEVIGIFNNNIFSYKNINICFFVN